MSGRAIRRLPVLALAKQISRGVAFSASSHSPTKKTTSGRGVGKSQITNGHTPRPLNAGGIDVEMWLDGMASVVKEQETEHERLS